MDLTPGQARAAHTKALAATADLIARTEADTGQPVPAEACSALAVQVITDDGALPWTENLLDVWSCVYWALYPAGGQSQALTGTAARAVADRST